MSAKKSTTAKSTKKSGSRSLPSHPTWIEMIIECITTHPEDARTGVSRPQIKRYVETQYHIEIGNAQNTQLSKAIASGAEKGTFVLPKGPSGRVKLPPKTARHETSAAKENKPAPKPKVVAKPKTAKTATTKATTVKKTAPKPRTTATSTAAKSSAGTSRASAAAAAANKSSAAKTAATKAKAAPPKKVLAGKKTAPAKKTTTTAKRGAAKKAVTGTTAPAKAKAAAASKTKAPAKKAPASGRKKTTARK